jgi:hypothetical protein
MVDCTSLDGEVERQFGLGSRNFARLGGRQPRGEEPDSPARKSAYNHRCGECSSAVIPTDSAYLPPHLYYQLIGLPL